MGVQLGGLASGMDTSSLISQLMQIERIPVTNKQQETQTLGNEKKVWQDIDSKLSSFKSSLSNLKLSSTFGSKSASVSDESFLTATAKTSAAAASYVLEDIVLADPGKGTSTDALAMTNGVKANVIGTSAIADANTRFNAGSGVSAGSFKINGINISVGEDDTINLIINKINTSTAGVKASFNSSSGEFTLEQKEVGTSKKIEINADDTSGFLTEMGLASSLGSTIENGENKDDIETFSENSGAGEVFEGVTSGFFTINNYTFELNSDSDSLSTIISDINESDAGVTAFYDEDTKKVTLTSSESGEDLVLENDTSGFLKAVNLMGAAETEKTYSGTNSTFKLNGIEFEKDSNAFEINGVNFELKSETAAGEKVTVTIKNDNDKSFEKIKSLIDDYNELVDLVSSKTAKGEILQGNSMANGLVYNLRNNLTNRVDGVDSKYNQLALIGISSESRSSAKMSIDTNKLKEALQANPSEVEELFTRTTGLGSIEDEDVAGSGTTYNLAETPSSTDNMVINVGGVSYSTDNSTYKIIVSGEPSENEVLVNLASGQLTFGTEPTEAVTATYDYLDETFNGGIASRMERYLLPLTQYSGIMDSQVKSIDNQIKDINKWVENMELRLSMREESLRKQYTAMEQAMSTSNSQGNWLTSQLSGMQ